MEWLKAHGFHAVTPLQAFEALEFGKPLPSKPVSITFDDGYRDVLWHAAPVLHRLHMPAVEFVITDRIWEPTRASSPGRSSRGSSTSASRSGRTR